MFTRRWRFILLLFILLSGATASFAQTTDKQKAELEWMLRVFPKSEPWEQWLKTTGELPPDFDALPRQAALPDPLLADADGKKVRLSSPGEWPGQRERLVGLVKRIQWALGEEPPTAVDVLEQVPFVDPKRIFVAGYSMGAMVGLHAAALDDRIAGVASVAGFTPMRLDKTDNGAAFVARWSRWHVLQPRLGAFVGQERRIPYDYHEVLALIAPRPLLVVVAPKVDSENTSADVEKCVAEVQKVYSLFDAEERLELRSPDDYNRYSPELQSQVNAWVKQAANR